MKHQQSSIFRIIETVAFDFVLRTLDASSMLLRYSKQLRFRGQPYYCLHHSGAFLSLEPTEFIDIAKRVLSRLLLPNCFFRIRKINKIWLSENERRHFHGLRIEQKKHFVVSGVQKFRISRLISREINKMKKR